MFRELISIFPKESETPSRHFICSWVKTDNLISEKKKVHMKITRYSLKNSALSTTVAALIFGIACSSAQASKPTSHRLRHSGNPVYLQEQSPSPDATSWYQPARSPGFNEDFGG
jgi:hypothetical protein